MRQPKEPLYSKLKLQVQIKTNTMFSFKYASRVVTRPKGKGTRFAANSPKSGPREKIFEKFCERGYEGEFRLNMGLLRC